MEPGAESAGPKRPKVLVIRGGAIGDFILTLPAIRLLRNSIPGCHLEVLGYPGIIDLAVKAGLAEAVRSFEHRTMAPLFAKSAAIDEDLTAYLSGFNLVVSYLYDPDGHFRASLERVGVKTLVECPHRVEPGQGHAAAQLARPLERLALFLGEHEIKAPVFDKGEPPAGGRRVAIHPGSGSVTKNWPLANWQAVAQELADSPATEVVLITGEAETDRGVTEAIRQGWHSIARRHWDSLPLPELVERLRTCSAFLGHDSGMSHLAAACGVPCLLLFGPTDPDVWAPPQETVRVLRAPNGHLKAIAPADVLAALEGKDGAL